MSGDRDDLLNQVEELTATINRLDERAANVRDQRLDVFRQLRALDPPVPFTAIATRAAMSDVGVKNVLRRAEAATDEP